MELGRIITLTDGAGHSMINKNWLTRIFVAGDVVSFLMQIAGQLSPSLKYRHYSLADATTFEIQVEELCPAALNQP